MASIANDPNGTRRILFTDPHALASGGGKRRTLRLGKAPKKHAEAMRVRVEALLASSITGQPVEPETAHWVAGVGDDLHDKLARVGLIEPRATATLGPFIDAYIDRRRPTLKHSTVLNLEQARDHLTRHLGHHRDLRSITPGDAGDWQATLRTVGLGENTIRRTTGRARQYFRDAIKRKLIDANPFEGLAAGVRPERSRDYFVSREETAAVLDACPDAEWRCMVALARFGGLRTPSETVRLRWCDIDWAAGRFTVTSPKTEHHDGHGTRIVPLFPELLPHLREAFELADDGAEYVITRTRDGGINLRTHLQRIIKRAGLIPWPKLWQNLRATRATELAQHFPQHVAAAWCGHSAKVAEQHYLQVTAEHFAKAATPEHPVGVAEGGALPDAGDDVSPEKHRPERPEKVARNPAQYPPAPARTESPNRPSRRTKPHRPAPNTPRMARPGLEPGTPAFSMPSNRP